MATINASRATHSGECTLTYPAIAGDTDLLTGRPTHALDGVSRKPRQIIVGGAGDLALRYFAGVTDTIPATAGQILNIQPEAILSATTATNITVLW
jgi:hypothetical protein